MDNSILNEFISENKYQIPFVDDKVAILASGRDIFSSKKTIELSHGGVTVEELIVPFVEVEV